MTWEFLVVLLAAVAAGLWLARSIRAATCGSGCAACPHRACPGQKPAALAPQKVLPQRSNRS